MKIFIATDLEGISGVVHPEHTGWDGRRHQEARKWVTEHVNAAVAASIEMGATEVLVCDGHSNGRNIILDLLHPDAQLMWGRQNRRLGQMDGIDQSYAAVLLIGQHARAGSPGVLNHTINSGVIHEVKMNGLPVGEIDMSAGVAGEFGVPVALVSGDSAACAQAKERMPQIETAAVMEPVGTYSAKILAPARAQALIQDATRRALARIAEMRPYRFSSPTMLDVAFKDTAMAEAAAAIPGAELTDPRAVRFAAKDFLEAYRAVRVMITLAATETWQRTA